MNISRIAILGVALVAGAGAFFLMIGNSSDQPAVQVVQPSKEQSVRVLIATRDIQRGERLAAEDTNWIDWPKKALQPTFITGEEPQVREEMANAVARSLIVTGEPIVNAKIVMAGSSGLMAAILTPGMRAVTMRITPETSSGGFILPGDRVDIYFTTRSKTKLIFEEVRILAINTMYSENTETAHIEGINATLELSPRDAESFTTARSKGALSLVLRSIFKPEGDHLADDRRSSDVDVIRYGRS